MLVFQRVVILMVLSLELLMLFVMIFIELVGHDLSRTANRQGR